MKKNDTNRELHLPGLPLADPDPLVFKLLTTPQPRTFAADSIYCHGIATV